jgi:hypothetical protein
MVEDKKVVELRSVLHRRSMGAAILARTIANRQRTSRKLSVSAAESSPRLVVDLARMTRPPQA